MFKYYDSSKYINKYIYYHIDYYWLIDLNISLQ